MSAAMTYPVHVDASLEPRLSRWLWLVKWFLAIPHYVVLAFLWVAFVLLSVGAFFAILFTGRYPRGVFDFNVGVLRWSWRVHYYTFGALGTDRYPPFTLDDVPDYPAHLEVDYPTRLSRGLVLVKWWLLALPHYVVVGIFLGGATWGVFKWGPSGLIGILAVVAGVMLAATGRYPQSIFDFIIGLDRWVLRVAAYAGLMTDKYPPFRLDTGGHEPTGGVTVTYGDVAPVTVTPPTAASDAPRATTFGAGRVVAVVSAVLLVLVSMGLLGAGGVATWAANARDGGYVTSAAHSYQAGGYAIASRHITIDGALSDHNWAGDLLGTVRIRVTSDDPRQPVFVGIARASTADRYLAGVSRSVFGTLSDNGSATTYAGQAPTVRPQQAGIWLASASGAGQQSLVWRVSGGDWRVVVMNADAGKGVAVTADAGATVPHLGAIAAGLMAAGAVALVGGIAILVVAIRRRTS